MSLKSNEIILDVWMCIYEHSPDSYLILKISIGGNADCALVPRAATGCTLGRGVGVSLEYSWVKGLIQQFPSAKWCRDTCPASLPVDLRWTQSHGSAHCRAVLGAVLPHSVMRDVEFSKMEVRMALGSLLSYLFPKCLHSPYRSFESLL